MSETSKLWREEYARQGIPSSYREDPSKVVVQMLSGLQERGVKVGKALDLGCGRGRNAFYLAQHGYEVFCLDLVPENVAKINAKAQEARLPVAAYCQDITHDWPVEKEQFDLAIDVFCYKHITDKEAQKKYRARLHKILKNQGYYFLSLAADDDGFYGPLLKTSPNPSLKQIIDPHSQISSFLYNMDEILGEFSDILQPAEAKKTESVSPMYGKEYSRQVLNILFRKNV
jgi:SAM-dependent methyltransferase